MKIRIYIPRLHGEAMPSQLFWLKFHIFNDPRSTGLESVELPISFSKNPIPRSESRHFFKTGTDFIDFCFQ